MSAPARVLVFPDDPDLDFSDPLGRAIKHAQFAAKEFARAIDTADNTNRVCGIRQRIGERIETLQAIEQMAFERWGVLLEEDK